MNKTKYLEYYMDSKIYSKDEVQKSIDETKKEFPNRQIDVQVHLNKFGVYIITFTFNKKNSFIRNIFIKLKFKKKNKLLLSESKKSNKEIQKNKVQKRFEKYNNKTYGQYKATHTYRPY